MKNIATAENVVKLAVREPPSIQAEALETLYSSLGRDHSRDVVERAVFEISDRLVWLEQSLFDGDLAETARLSSSLVKLSSQIGLDVFATVAQGLSDTIKEQDAVAAAALAGRLLRLGEASLYHVVELVGQSG